MPAPVTAESLVDRPIVKKLLKAIDDDAYAAIDTAESVIASPTGKLYSASTLARYKGDVARLDRCWGDFNAAWNRVKNGRVRSNKEIIKTYHKYVLSLEILEVSNVRHEAMMQAGFAELAALLLDKLIVGTKDFRKRCKALEARLTELRALIKTAERQVIGVGAQAAVNLALTGVMSCFGPAGIGARLGLVAVSIGAQVVIDAALGSSGASVLGTFTSASVEVTGAAPRFDAAGKRLFAGVNAVINLKMDADEMAEAIAIMEKLKKALIETDKEYRELCRMVGRLSLDVGKLKVSYDRALRTFESAAGRFRSSQRRRMELMREFRAWR